MSTIHISAYLGTLGKAKAHGWRKLDEWWEEHQLTTKYRRIKRVFMSKRLRQAAYTVEEPGLPQIGTEQFGMEELGENQGGHRLEDRETRNDQLDGKGRKQKFSRVLPFNKLHQGDHQTEVGNCSFTNLQNCQVNLSGQEDRNSKSSMIKEYMDESQPKGETLPSHAVIMVKPADDAVINY